MSKTIAYETANGPQQVDVAHPLPISGSISAVSSAVATAVAPTLVEGSTNAFSSDLAGGLRITGTINATSATTNTAAAPSYVEGTANAFSGNLTGDLRVIAKQSGTWVIGAGSAVIGKTSIDQTTPGTTNAVAVTNLPVTVDVNSGNKSNSTLRVVLATDQPALTNKLLVTPDSVALPANQSVNVSQINGVTTLMGNGATGTGSQRVTLANDSTAIAGWGQGATGAAVPTGAVYIGASVAGTLTGLVATANGLKVDGSAVTQPVSIATAPVLVAGSAVIGKVSIDQTTPGTTNLVQVTHGKSIKTASGTLTADTDVIAAVSSKRIKVIAYSLFTTGTNVDLILFKSNGAAGTELWRVPLQSQASALFGANLAIPAPSFLFATVAGEKLTMDVNQTDTIHYSITYFDDDAT